MKVKICDLETKLRGVGSENRYLVTFGGGDFLRLKLFVFEDKYNF